MKDIVGYLPTINAPATEVKTINAILSKSDEIRKVLNLKEIVVVMPKQQKSNGSIQTLTAPKSADLEHSTQFAIWQR